MQEKNVAWLAWGPVSFVLVATNSYSSSEWGIVLAARRKYCTLHLCAYCYISQWTAAHSTHYRLVSLSLIAQFDRFLKRRHILSFQFKDFSSLFNEGWKRRGVLLLQLSEKWFKWMEDVRINSVGSTTVVSVVEKRTTLSLLQKNRRESADAGMLAFSVYSLSYQGYLGVYFDRFLTPKTLNFQSDKTHI